MKKTTAVLLLVAVLCTGAYLGSSILQKYEQKQQVQENCQTLAAFSFQNLAGQAFELNDMAAGQPTLVIYFNPDCEHCQYEARAIRDSLHRFEQTNVLLISDEPSARLQEFGAEYDLLGYPNVHILHDANGDFRRLFGTSSVPSIFIYNRERELVKHFKGETKIEAILKYLQ